MTSGATENVLGKQQFHLDYFVIQHQMNDKSPRSLRFDHGLRSFSSGHFEDQGRDSMARKSARWRVNMRSWSNLQQILHVEAYVEITVRRICAPLNSTPELPYFASSAASSD